MGSLCSIIVGIAQAGIASTSTGPASDAAPAEQTGQSLDQLLHLFAKMHVVVIHFPIALLLAGALAEMLSLVPRCKAIGAASRFCATIGALSALCAATMGWMLATHLNYTRALQETLTVHRWLGVAAAAWSVGVGALAFWSRNDQSGGRVLAFRAALIIGAGLVGAAGHFGGSLVYGLDYFAE